MRNEWIIYHSNGYELAKVKELEYHGEWMGDEFITVTVKSPKPLEFRYNDYLEYRSQKYYIDYDPNKIHRAKKDSYGEAFVYENIKLYHVSHVLKDVMFKDYVLNDNGMAYSQQAKFSFFAGSVEDLADRIKANLDKAFGTNVWKVLTPVYSRSHTRNGISSDDWGDYYNSSILSGIQDVNVSCDGITCKDALKLAYDQFGLSYVIIGNDIIIGGTRGIDLSSSLEYGKGNGLYELEKNHDDTQQVVTKMYAYGSSENMQLNYYANIGKTAVAQINHGTKREIIIGNPELVLWVKKPWNEVKSAFGSSLSVTLEYNGMKVQANVSCDTYTYAKEKDDDEHGLNHETKYLYFWMLESDGNEAVAFYDALENGGLVTITGGANINALPNDMVVGRKDYPALLSIQNLMLPGFPDKSLLQWVLQDGGTNLGNGMAIWRGHTAYFSNEVKNPWIKSVNADTIGEREGAVYFDGSSNDVEDIHPTIKDTGADVVYSGTAVTDNGYLAEGTDLSFNMIAVDDDDSDFDWADAWANASEDIYVNMTSGYCVGRAFKLLSKPKKSGSSWKLTLERAYDSSLQRYFPYQDTAGNYAQVVSGDTFVVTGAQMSQSLVNAASEKLLEEALKALDEMDHPKVTYIPKIYEIEAARERDEKTDGSSLYDTIHAGLRLTFKDTSDGANEPPAVTQYIDTLTIKENGNNGIPTFDVVLRDEKELSLQQRIRNQIESMSGSGSGKSSSGKSSAEEEPVPTGGDCLTPLLFELHKDDPLEGDKVIEPEDWQSAIEEDDEAAEEAGEGYVTPLSIKAKRGTWTNQFLSALGLGTSEGTGLDLEEPLFSINSQPLGLPPNNEGKVGIVWNPDTMQYEWGETGGGGISGLHILDGNTEILPQESEGSVTYKLSDYFLSLKEGGTIIKDVFINRPTAISDFTAISDNLVLTFGEMKSYFEGKFVTVEFWNSLFKTFNGKTEVPVNTKNPIIDNLKILVGTWTQQYLSALGNGTSGSGLELNHLLYTLNNTAGIQGTPGSGDTLVFENGSWTFGTAGLDENQLANYLNTNDYIKGDANTKWWGRTMSNGVVKGDIDMDSNKCIGWNIPGTSEYLSMVELKAESSNRFFILGEGTAVNNIPTYLRGSSIYFQTASGNVDASLTQQAVGDPIFYVKKLKIGSIVISEDTQRGGIHIENAGLYADEWISALGAGTSGGGDYFDADAMWKELNGTSSAYPKIIDADYMTPNLDSIYLRKTEVGTLILTDKEGTTEYGRWTPTTAGESTIKIDGGVSDKYLPLTAGSDKPLEGALYIKTSTDQKIYFKNGNTLRGSLGINSNGLLYRYDASGNGKKIYDEGTTMLSTFANDGNNLKISIGGQTAQSLELAYAKKSGECTGNSASATKLNITESKTLFGNIYFSNGVPLSKGTSSTDTANLSYVGSISMNSYITGCTYIDSIAYFSNSNLGVGQNSPQYRLDVNGTIRVGTKANLIGCSSNYLELGCYDNELVVSESNTSGTLHVNYRTSGFTGNSIPSTWNWNAGNSSSWAKFVLGELEAKTQIKIGGATLKWVAGKGLNINTGFYSDSFISALGEGSSSGGVDVTGSLQFSSASNSLTLILNNNPQNSVNLSSMLTGYAKTADVTKNLTVEKSDGTVLVGYNGTQNVTLTIPDGGFEMKSVTNATLKGLSGTFGFYGQNLPDNDTRNYDWVGIQVGTTNDKWQLMADSGHLMVRQNDAGGSSSTGWVPVSSVESSGWYTVLDSGNYKSVIGNTYSTEDTKNTAGSTVYTGTGDRLYIIGADSMTTYRQTYANVNCYIKDNYLYSNGGRAIAPVPAASHNLNFADSIGTGGIYQIHSGLATKDASWPFDYGLVANFVSTNGHLQIAASNAKNDIKIRSYWWTGNSQFGSYPDWQTLIHSGNVSSYIPDTSNFVDITSNQNINGIKNFIGKVGIGTADPKKRLHVFGAIRCERTDAEGGGFQAVYGSNISSIQTNANGNCVIQNGTVSTDGTASVSACCSFSPSGAAAPYMLLKSSTRIYANDNTLYLGTSTNAGWVYLQDCASAESTSNWALRTNGDARFLWVGINGNNTSYRLYVNGTSLHTDQIYLNAGKGISCVGSKATYEVIKFLDNTNDTYGQGIAIGGGGLTIIGGGESANAAAQALGTYGGSEQMLICNDGNIEFYPNMQNGWNSKVSFIMTAGGAFGINTASPSYNLHVNGTSYLGGNTTAAGFISPSQSTAFSLGSSSTRWSTVYCNSVNANSSSLFTGQTSIGSSASNYTHGNSTYQSAGRNAKFFVQGSAFINGKLWVVDFQNISDIREKEIISEVDSLDVDNIARAPIFNFCWRGSYDGMQMVGTSAQYWKEILPNVTRGGGTEVMSMDYGATALASAVITARKVLDHEGEIKALRKRIGELEQEIETLKAA